MIPLDLGNYGGGLQIFTADSQGPTPENPNAAPLGVRQVTGASSSGNPYLNPWRSNNYDLAIEYYLGRASMFNVGLFKLDINSFVTTGTDKGSFPDQDGVIRREVPVRSEEHTSELQSLTRNSYAVFCLKKNKYKHKHLQ